MNPYLPAVIPESRTRRYRILSLGAGVQSTCVYLLGMRGEIPAFNAAVFADTGDEPAEVYKHLKWMQSLGGPTIHIVKQSETSLGENLIKGRNATGRSHCSIPSFTSRTEGVRGGITKRQCTSEYKIAPIERWVRMDLLGVSPGKRAPSDAFVVQLIGISLDESARAIRVMRKWDTKWNAPEFPLIQLGWTRNDCLRWMARNHYPKPPRSACVFCPYKTDTEWLRLKTHDHEGWKKALAIDEAIRDAHSRCTQGMRDRMYLHRSCMPLKDIDLAKRIEERKKDGEQLGFWQECQGMCGN